MAIDTRFCDGYLTIKPRKGKKGNVAAPRQSTNNVYHVQNAFHKAVEDGDITQVKVLLRYAQLNIHLGETNKHGRTALQECCLKDDIDMMRLLVENGASLESTDTYGWTTLHYASFFGSLDIVRFLVLNCADLNAVNNSGETPYDLAQQEDVKFYIQGMMMMKSGNCSEVDEVDDDYYSDERSWRNESDTDSIGNSIDVKTSDSHDTIDTGYEDETPPLSPTKLQHEKPLSGRHRRFGLLRPNSLIQECKGTQMRSPRARERKVSESNSSLEVVREDDVQSEAECNKEIAEDGHFDEFNFLSEAVEESDVMHDITDEKEIEEEKIESNFSLEIANTEDYNKISNGMEIDEERNECKVRRFHSPLEAFKERRFQSKATGEETGIQRYERKECNSISEAAKEDDCRNRSENENEMIQRDKQEKLDQSKKDEIKGAKNRVIPTRKLSSENRSPRSKFGFFGTSTKNTVKCKSTKKDASKEAIKPKKDVLKPKKEIIILNKDVTMSKKEVIRPLKDSMTPNKEVKLSYKEVMSPKKDITSPNKEAITSSSELVRPDREVNSPNKDVIMSNTDALRPNKEDMLPNKEALRPNKEVVQPNKEITVPNKELPKEEENSVKKPTGIPRLNFQKKDNPKKSATNGNIRKIREISKTGENSDKNQLNSVKLQRRFKGTKIWKVSSEPDITNIPEEKQFQFEKPRMKKVANMQQLHMIEKEEKN